MSMRNIIADIIPPNNYQSRNGFSNLHIINALSVEEKANLEPILIDMLSNFPTDMLIVETLGNLRSTLALPLLRQLLTESDEWMEKLIIACSVFQISNDSSMVLIGLDSIKNLDNKADPYYVYKLTHAFFYLSKLKSQKVVTLLQSYSMHENYLIAYNAKRALSSY